MVVGGLILPVNHGSSSHHMVRSLPAWDSSPITQIDNKNSHTFIKHKKAIEDIELSRVIFAHIILIVVSNIKNVEYCKKKVMYISGKQVSDAIRSQKKDQNQNQKRK